MGELSKILENMPARLQEFYVAHINAVQTGIKSYFPERVDADFYERISGQVNIYPQDLEGLYETTFRPTREYLERGGKVLRPILAALCLEAYGSDSSKFVPLMAAIEVMEDSSIIMDDYIDNSLLRRGGPCAHVAHGYPIANISSCTAFAMSHYIFYNNELGLSEAKRARLLNAVAWEHIQMAFGQIEELYWTESNVNDVSVDQYLQETIARCAFLTFRGPLRYAAIIADAPEEDIPVLERIGEYMLVGYHIKGDDMDMSPDSAAWGKVAGEDISTGRRTLLINYLLGQVTPEERKRLEEILDSRTRDEDEKREVYELVIKHNVFDHTRKLADEYNRKTKEQIDLLHMADDFKDLFKLFSDYSTVKRAM